MTARHVVPLLSAYVDGELAGAMAQQVETHLRACDSCRLWWDQVRAGKSLADLLTQVDPPPGMWDDVQRGIQRTRELSRAEGSRARGLNRLRFPPRATAALAALSLSLLALVLFFTGSSARTSAAAVLSTADEALVRAVQPGELLHRRWRWTRIITRPGAPPVRDNWISDSWLGGPNLNRSVGRVTAADGRLMSIYYSEPEAGGLRAHAYLSPDYPGDLHGVHLVFPTKAEREAAMALLAPDDRTVIARYYDEPSRPDNESLLLWEHRMNRALLENPAHDQSAGLNIVLSLESAVMPNGEAAHCVKQLVLGAPWLDWRADGTPVFQLARVTANQYISRNSFLSLKFESDVDLEDGSRSVATTELESIQSVRPTATSDPFAVTLPPATPVIRVAMQPYLIELAKALRRSHAQISTSTRNR
jgi:hypothetical protein